MSSTPTTGSPSSSKSGGTHNGQRWYCREMIRASEQRVVVVEFPSMDRLRGWYSSADYAEGLPMRDTALTRRLLFVLS
jgi:uncharacterized protein (DUF1330 family)